MNLEVIRQKVLSKDNEFRSLIERKDVLLTEMTTLDNIFQATKEAQEVIQQVAEGVQRVAHERISVVVTRCLETVFPNDPYEFNIKFERKRGKTEANLIFTRGGNDLDPLDSSGGGAIDVAAFALRLSCLMLTRPKLTSLTIMDEPFKFVSEEYRDGVKSMLLELSQELGIQFIMITHINELKTGNVIYL